MARLIETLILNAASEENLDLEQFIEELRKSPDEWYSFRRHELVKFIDSILFNVSLLTDASAVVPTGPTHEQLQIHFGLRDVPSPTEEQPVDWHAGE